MDHSITQHLRQAPEAPKSPQRGGLLRALTHGTGLSRGQRFALYLGVGFAALAMIWLPVALFLTFMPATYSSRWSLILPSAGAGSAVSLESVGQASTTVSSPYATQAVDPRVNYKAVAESPPVLAAAAAKLGMTVEEFGEPRIKLVDQTALMHFRVSASHPRVAAAKSQALYAALQTELDRLRGDELVSREEAINDMLRGFSGKLQSAQQRILDQQSRARIVSMEQFTELTVALERMRGELRGLRAEHAQVQGRSASLQAIMAVSALQASAALSLEKDPLFRQLSLAWAEASSLYTQNRAKWGAKHEAVLNARDSSRALRREMLARVKALAPNLDIEPGKLAALLGRDAAQYRDLVDLAAQANGMALKIESLTDSIHAQQILLESSITEASTLEDLRRKHQVATAVFTTALAKVDIGKSDRFSSYPLVQLLAQPSLPVKADALAVNLALLGAGAGSFFILFGLTLLWIRKPYLQKLLKND